MYTTAMIGALTLSYGNAADPAQGNRLIARQKKIEIDLTPGSRFNPEDLTSESDDVHPDYSARRRRGSRSNPIDLTSDGPVGYPARSIFRHNWDLRPNLETRNMRVRPDVAEWDSKTVGNYDHVQPRQYSEGFNRVWLVKALKVQKHIIEILDDGRNRTPDYRQLMKITKKSIQRSKIDGSIISGTTIFVDTTGRDLSMTTDNSFPWNASYVEHYLMEKNCLPTRQFYEFMNDLFYLIGERKGQYAYNIEQDNNHLTVDSLLNSRAGRILYKDASLPEMYEQPQV